MSPVFEKRNGGESNPESLSITSARLVDRAGVSTMTISGLRHTHAALALNRGVNPLVVPDSSTHPHHEDARSHRGTFAVDPGAGLVDADVHGPSVPGMLGIPFDGGPLGTEDGRMVPGERHGIKAESIGLLRDDDNPAILRGPMVSKYLQMLVGQVAWGQLEYRDRIRETCERKRFTIRFQRCCSYE